MSKDQQEKSNSGGKKHKSMSKSGDKPKSKSSGKSASKGSSSGSKSTKNSGNHTSSRKSTGDGKGSSGSSKSKHSHSKDHSSSSSKSSSSTSSKTSKNSVILKSYKTQGQICKVATGKEILLTADKSQEVNAKTSTRSRSVLVEKSKAMAAAGTSKEKIASKMNAAKNTDSKCPDEGDAMPMVAIVEKKPEAEAQKVVEPSKDNSKEKMKSGDSNTILANILSESFRNTSRKESVKLKVKPAEKTNEWNDHGSTFANNVNRDDSAMALVMHTARDEVEIKREETEIFCPGKGDLRSTQPDAQDDNSPKEQP